MKIIVLTRYYPFHRHAGGMETHAKNVAEFFARDGHEVHVVTTRRDNQSFGLQEENGVTIHATDSWITFGIFGNWWWKCLDEIRKIHQESTVNCVISEGTSGYSYLANSLSKQIPCIYIAHGDVLTEIRSKLYRLPNPKAIFGIVKLSVFFFIDTLLLRRTKVVVAITDLVKRELERLYPSIKNKIRIIPNGIDTEKFRPMSNKAEFPEQFHHWSEDQRFTVISIGRISKEKGVHILMEAARHLKTEPIRFLVVGEGEYMEEAKQFVKHDSLEQSVFFLGRVSSEEAPYLYNLANIAVFPSMRRAEGLPYVLLESMACGVPSICSDVRGFHEVIAESGIGWLVPPGNAETLASTIGEIIKKKDELAAIKYNAVLYVQKRFDMNKNIRQVGEIIKSV